MKLRSLELEQFRKFESPVRLGGFTDGLNILSGPNEFGKSTLLAAIRGLLFERYSSRADPIRRMQTWRGNAAPRLAMDFELAGGVWRIEKRFWHQPSARLRAPDGQVFEADAAEEELQRLLNFGAAGRKGATGDQLGVWGALWVTQRQSVDQADLSSDLAKSTVAACLDAEVGVLTGGERGHAVKRAAETALGRLLDGNNRPKGRYKELIAELAAVTEELAKLQDRALRLQTDSDTLRQALARLRKTDDPVAAAADQEALADARRRLTAAQLFDEKRATAAAGLELAKQQADQAATELAMRARRQTDIAASEAANCAAAAATDQARTAFTDASRLANAARSAADAAETRVARAAEAIHRHREILRLVQQESQRHALDQALAQAEAVQAGIEKHLAALAATRVDKTCIDTIRKAARAHETAEAALRALATEIELELQENADHVTIDGVPIRPGRHTRHAVSAMDIVVPGIGRITIRPAMQDREKSLATSRACRDRLAEALARAGCATADDAEQAFLEHETRLAELAEARTRLGQLTPGDPGQNLPPGLPALRERLAVLRLTLADATARLSLANLPDLASASQALAAAEADDTAARSALTLARAEQDAAASASAAAEAALIRAESAATASAADLARLQREVAGARESDEALAARLQTAEAARAAHANHLAQLDRDRPADSVAFMQARIDRFEKSIANRAEATRKLREEIASLRARITVEGGAGLDELIAAALRRQAEIARERDSSAHEAETLRLLLQTLTEAERETRERYLAPVTRRIAPYLAGLFPGATIACDDSLRITALSRDTATPQDFDRLSDGTQEQIAVLARLAFAELLLDQGKPAMVILDDALAYSDDARMDRMFDILTKAARRMQILVLTCREDLFARAGGHTLKLGPA
jgi:energy-coupling factor transporter ATP-binding protein EcfA2